MSQDRPCKRCIKRNIGHLCHDEPREGHGYHKKSKADSDATGGDEPSSPKDEYATATALPGPALMDDSGHNLLQDDNIGLRPSANDTMPVSHQSSAAQSAGLNGNAQARKCMLTPVKYSILTARQILDITIRGLECRTDFTICMLSILITCLMQTKSLTNTTC